MRPIQSKPTPILMLRKMLTASGAPESEVRLATSRAKRVNAGLSPLPPSGGSTPEQIRRAMAAARAAAKKVTITTTTIVDDGEDDDTIDETDDDTLDVAPDDGDESDDNDKANGKKKRATLASLQRSVATLSREAAARKAGFSSREAQRAEEDRVWRKMGLDPAAVRASEATRRASSRAPLGSPSYVHGIDADHKVIREAAKQGAELSREHVKMLRKMGHDDAAILAIAAKLAKEAT